MNFLFMKFFLIVKFFFGGEPEYIMSNLIVQRVLLDSVKLKV